jgi:VIT1/CCC1 family predicted Fe2+/Mn2+ transporter
VQAALASAASFSVGAALPLVVAALASGPSLAVWVALASLVFLCALGAQAARAAGADIVVGTGRVASWGALAMAITAGAGALFGAVG